MGKDDEFDYSVLDTSALVYLFIPESLKGRFGGNGTRQEIEVDINLNGDRKTKPFKMQNYFRENKNKYNFVITPTIKEELGREKYGKNGGIIYKELGRRGINGKAARKLINKRGQKLTDEIGLLDRKIDDDLFNKLDQKFEDKSKKLSMDEWKSLFNSKDPLPEDNDLCIITEIIQEAREDNNICLLSDDKHFTLPTYREFLKENYSIEVLPLDDL